MVAVKRVSSGTATVEDEVVGVYPDVDGDENGVSGEVDEGGQARGWVGGRASGGDRHGKLLRLRGGADRVNGADDGAIGVAAADGGCQGGCCQSEPEWRPEGLGQVPNGAPVWPRLGVCLCFDSC
jgi:hypothetical protein